MIADALEVETDLGVGVVEGKPGGEDEGGFADAA